MDNDLIMLLYLLVIIHTLSLFQNKANSQADTLNIGCQETEVEISKKWVSPWRCTKVFKITVGAW